MKRKTIVASMLMLGVLGLSGCTGDVGVSGLQGPQGEPGVTGPQGEPGKDGTSLLTGKGTPSTSLGNVGDSYIDTDTWDYYVKGTEGWVKAGNIKGADGADGDKGQDGAQGEPGPAGPQGDDGLSAYETYIKYHPEYEGDEEQWINDLVNGALSEPKYWTLTFETNGGTIIDSVQAVDKGILAYYLPEDPKKEEFKFDGWYLDADLEQPVDPLMPITGDMTLHAGWNEDVLIVWAPPDEIPVIDQVIGDYNASVSEEEAIDYAVREMWETDAASYFLEDPLQKNYPSLIAVTDDSLAEMHNTYDCIAPLSIGAAAEIEYAHCEAAAEIATVDGAMYGYPFSIDNGYFLYYNKEFFTAEQAGSMESLLATAKEKGKKFLFDFDNGYYSASIFMSQEIFPGESISWHYNDENEVVYDLRWVSREGAKLAMDFSELIVPYIQDGTFIEGDNFAISQFSKTGELQAVVCGSWIYEELAKNWGVENVVATKLPTFNYIFLMDALPIPTECQMASFIGGKEYVVNSLATEAEQALAHKVAQLLTSEEAQLIRWEMRGMVPTNLASRNDARFTSTITPYVQGLLEQEPYGVVLSRAVEPLYWTPGENIGRTIMQGYYDFSNPLTDLDDWLEYLETVTETLTDPSVRIY